MNKRIAFVSSLLIALWMVQSCGTSAKVAKTDAAAFEYSESVSQIVQGKCYGCHSADGRIEEAKKALMWDEVPKWSRNEQIHILEEILEVTEERSMPPARMVERKPELKLTDEEVATFQAWAKDMKAALMQ